MQGNAWCLLARLLLIWISCLSLSIFPSFSLTHTPTPLFSACFSSHPFACGPLARLASVDYSSHGYHDLTQTTFVSSFITVPPRLSTLVYSSTLYFCIPASRVKMHVTSTTENNPQKSPLIFAQICKCQWR